MAVRHVSFIHMYLICLTQLFTKICSRTTLDIGLRICQRWWVLMTDFDYSTAGSFHYFQGRINCSSDILVGASWPAWHILSRNNDSLDCSVRRLDTPLLPLRLRYSRFPMWWCLKNVSSLCCFILIASEWSAAYSGIKRKQSLGNKWILISKVPNLNFSAAVWTFAGLCSYQNPSMT